MFVRHVRNVRPRGGDSVDGDGNPHIDSEDEPPLLVSSADFRPETPAANALEPVERDCAEQLTNVTGLSADDESAPPRRGTRQRRAPDRLCYYS